MSDNFEQYLKTSLAKYKHPNVAKRDVATIFQPFKDLRPVMSPFIFNDGTQKELLSLDGTIPVMYKGNTYNIPICIWILDTHPYNPPMVFVKPTATMQIKQGKHVNTNGKVDLPYLREWKYPQSDLLGLIQILTIVFGEEPPVFAKQSRGPYAGPGNQSPYPPAQTPYQPPGGAQPPYPPTGGAQPPYPPAGGAGQTPYPPQSGSFMPMPNMPAASGTTPYPSAGYPPSTGYPPYPSATSYPQQSYPSQQSYPPYPTPNTSYPSTNTPYPPSYSQYPGSSSYPGTTTNSSQGSGAITGTSTVTEEHLKASMLSAVEDKMKYMLKETFAQAQAEMDALYKTHVDLTKGKEKLDQMVEELVQEKDQTEKNIHLLRQKDGEIKDGLAKMENQDKLDIDEAVVTTAPLYRQLVNSFAEDQAIEDAIYYLGEALRKDVTDLDVFLKQIRELSRRQFMLRALIQRCRDKAGLPSLL